MQPLNRNACELERDILPSNVRPTHYDLTIDPDFTQFTFNGRAVVSVAIKEATERIVMNASELRVKSVSVLGASAVAKVNVEMDKANDRVSFVLLDAQGKDVQAKAGTELTLSIDYTGDISDKMAGFYRSTYEDRSSGEKRVIGVTQFEATDARKAFPCWDEPAVKATFDVTLVIPEHLTGLSNMDEVERRSVGSGKVAVKFRRTPAMSTYLVAWVIGDLDSVETVNEDGISVRVFTPKGDVEQGRFALDVAARTLAFFTRYFDEPYPLPKMDLVAIPDFGAGAMENWGLVTYRTVYLLFDERSSSLRTKQNVAYVVGHELAHQWFGNLVTMEWWSDLWLNEGFATWVGWLAADQLFPEWDIWTEFVLDDCQAGLSLDGLRSSHPIEVPVRNPSQIAQIFDAISYSKGASLIRMLVTFLGAEKFQKGLRAYLKRHRLANAKTADLWAALSASSGQPVAEIMDTWTKTVGYPVVRVEQDAKCCLHVHQSRFLSTGDVKPEEDQTVWSVPLNVSTEKHEWKPFLPSSDDLLRERSSQIQLDTCTDTYKLNMSQAGFYRVEYPKEHWARLGKAIEAGKLSASDRIGIISDVFSLSIAGRVGVAECLDLLRFFEREDDYIVWGELSSRLSELLSVWWEQPVEQIDALKQLLRQIYQSQARALGFDPRPGESDKVTLMRPLIIGMAGKAGDEAVIREARERFSRFVTTKDESAIHPNLRGTVYGLVIRNGGRAEYEQVLKLYMSQSVADQKLAALSALGLSSDPAILSDALRLTLQSEPVRPQDVMYVFRAVGANPFGRRLGWQFVKEHWSAFHARYFNGSIALLSRIISTSTDSFSAVSDADDVTAFFAKCDSTSIDRTIQQSVERIRLQAAWLKRNKEPVSKWLGQFAKVGRIVV